MAKIRQVENLGIYAFRCPGCGHDHMYWTKPSGRKPVWTFNGNMDSPTFTPSLMNTTGSLAQPGYQDPEGLPPTRCHLFITNGKIQFLSDCTHHLAGQTVDLPEINS